MFDWIWREPLPVAAGIAFLLSSLELFTHNIARAFRIVRGRDQSAPTSPLVPIAGMAASAVMLLGVLISHQYQSAYSTVSVIYPSPGREPSSTDGSAEQTTDLLQQAYAALHFGKFVYNPPDEMVENKTELVSVRVYRDQEPSAQDAPMAGAGSPRTESIKVAPRMAVELSGDNFAVRSNSPRIQFIPEGGFAEWVFHVKPSAGGEQLLVLQASVLVGAHDETELPAITRKIRVQILAKPQIPARSWFDRFVAVTGFWKWILGILAVAITGIGGYFLRRWWESRSL